MKVADFDFFLPEYLVAERPLKERSNSRLLVLHKDGIVEHKRFSDLPSYLDKGDLLLTNNTRVFPARLTGLKKSGGRLEILLVRKTESNAWEVLSKGRFTGTLKISEGLQLELHNGDTAYFKYSGDFMDIIWKYGNMPLPPYIKRSPDESDKETYQTIYAKKEGSIAAPTAGLHFTNRLLNKITSKGI
jgi:S-adenosylmethionine:tRNA ribosyltransferase-isomerase